MKRLALIAMAAAMLATPTEAAPGDTRIPAFVRGRLVCSLNLNRIAAVNGLRATGSAAAASWLQFPHVRKAEARWGDVLHTWRGRGGGHVRLVIGRRGGRLMCLNPSTRRQAWVVIPCPAKGTIVRPGKRGSAHRGKHRRSK